MDFFGLLSYFIALIFCLGLLEVFVGCTFWSWFGCDLVVWFTSSRSLFVLFSMQLVNAIDFWQFHDHCSGPHNAISALRWKKNFRSEKKNKKLFLPFSQLSGPLENSGDRPAVSRAVQS